MQAFPRTCATSVVRLFVWGGREDRQILELVVGSPHLAVRVIWR